MRRSHRIISIILIFSLLSGFFFYPQPAEARSIFSRLFQFAKWITNFVIKTPGKIASALTRPLGPVLGPIAANILLSNTPNRILEVISKAEKVQAGINVFDQQQKKLKNAQNILLDRATEVYEEVDKLYDVKKQLEKQLLSGDIKYEEYRDNIIALDKMAEAYEETADRMIDAAENLKPENLLRQIATDVLRTGKRKTQRVVMRRVGEELQKIINVDIIQKFLGKKGLNAVKVIDLIVASDITRILKESGLGDDPDFDKMLDDIKKEIKDMLKKDRDFLEGNWREVLDKKIKEILEKNKLKNINAGLNINLQPESEVDKQSDSYVDDPSQIPLDEKGCAPGWTWDIKVGKCKQENCNEIKDAHWSYTVDCVCGSSGSINEDPVNDPNQECAYKNTYGPCPSCVYACVKLSAECPKSSTDSQSDSSLLDELLEIEED